MQTYTWSHDVVDPKRDDAFLFSYLVGADIAEAILATGGTLDWSRDLYTGPDGAWRLPALDEHGAHGYLHSLRSVRGSEDLLESNHATPHGWSAALQAGQCIQHGDKVRIELTCFDSGRHLLEGWTTKGDHHRLAGATFYGAIAHLSKSQDVLGQQLTREQVRALVADPDAAAPPRPADPHAELEAEMMALQREFAQRRAEILTRHGLDPDAPFGRTH